MAAVIEPAECACGLIRRVDKAAEAEWTITTHLVGMADVSKGATTRLSAGPSGSESITDTASLRARTFVPIPCHVGDSVRLEHIAEPAYRVLVGHNLSTEDAFGNAGRIR